MDENYAQIQEDIDLLFPMISGKVSMAVNQLINRNLRRNGLDITPEQWSVLAVLWRKDGPTQQQLCDATYKDKPSMTRLVDNLEKQGYVLRCNSKKDRRSNYIFLTEKGISIKERAHKSVHDAINSALENMKLDDFIKARYVLASIFTNIQDALKEGK